MESATSPSEKSTIETPRAPSFEEFLDLAAAISAHDGCDTSLENALVAVFDRYVTDGPGYSSKIASIVWPGGPELMTTVTVDTSGRFKHVHQA